MPEIMCFGDSNTWGFDAATQDRFARDVRWTGVLQELLGSSYRIIEEGLNGRTTVWEDPVEGDKMGRRHLVPCLDSQAPLDLVVIMLGTNDLKQRYSAPPSDIAAGAGVLLDTVAASRAGRGGKPPKALLIAPPPLARLSAYADLFLGGQEKSRVLAPLYAEAARQRGAGFLDAGTVIRSSDLDGVHFEASEHRKLAAALAPLIKRLAPG